MRLENKLDLWVTHYTVISLLAKQSYFLEQKSISNNESESIYWLIDNDSWWWWYSSFQKLEVLHTQHIIKTSVPLSPHSGSWWWGRVVLGGTVSVEWLIVLLTVIDNINHVLLWRQGLLLREVLAEEVDGGFVGWHHDCSVRNLSNELSGESAVEPTVTFLLPYQRQGLQQVTVLVPFFSKSGSCHLCKIGIKRNPINYNP